MALTTRSRARMPPPTERSSRYQVVGCEKSKSLVLREGPTTRKSNRSISQTSQKQNPSIVNNHTPDTESDGEYDLQDEEGAFKSDSDESEAGHLDPENEDLESLARRNQNFKKQTRSNT